MSAIAPPPTARPVLMIALWGVVTGGATLAASQTISTSGENIWAALIALITAGGAVLAAWVASRYRRNSGPTEMSNDEIVISRKEYERLLHAVERLRELERRRRER